MARNIQRPVGVGCPNRPADVMTVQYLLNCVPTVRGGPTTELPVDGKLTLLSAVAIARFQTVRFGRPTGRIDPTSTSLRALVEFDPYPTRRLPGPRSTIDVVKMPMPPAP